MIPIFPTFDMAIRATESQMLNLSYRVQNSSWQSSDVTKRPEMQTQELYDVAFKVQLRPDMTLEDWAKDIQPNMPWAEDHFLERVGGIPWNPGETWKSWPWSLSADKFRTEGEKFSHNYMERYWPKHAGIMSDYETREDGGLLLTKPHPGIIYQLGDQDDVVNLIAKDPLTRQAYLPIWFPEDTGVVHGERVPCSLGYHFLHRGSHLHCNYFIRSCDLTRHFRDDLYLTVRLQLWVLEQLRKRSESWEAVDAGFFSFHCISMHTFMNDFQQLKEKWNG